ncbi:hypothetical protein EDD17DRAFT_1176016 [Pisolithus thermaeus]|nr:hypothetical protein EDD17DRAFT_1176016 [Pisolithus thermaeus]
MIPVVELLKLLGLYLPFLTLRGLNADMVLSLPHGTSDWTLFRRARDVSGLTSKGMDPTLHDDGSMNDLLRCHRVFGMCAGALCKNMPRYSRRSLPETKHASLFHLPGIWRKSKTRAPSIAVHLIFDQIQTEPCGTGKCCVTLRAPEYQTRY